MQELVRLRQQQQTTEQQLQTVGQKVQVMEQRQQQMMSFLAKAMQSPGFLNQLVQHQNDSNRRIAGGNKKRRLPRQGEENLAGEHPASGPNGQIVKFQPSMDEAAKAMLHQIMKMNASPRLEASVNNPGTFLINDISSSNVLENGSSLNGVSGVTLSEVSPVSGQSSISAKLGFPVSGTSTAITEMQSSPCMVSESGKVDQIPEMNMHHCGEDIILANSSQVQENMSGNTVGNTDANFMDSEVNAVSILDEKKAIKTKIVSPEHDIDFFMDGAPKLPGINDLFWEQFLAVSQLTVDTGEINSSSLDSCVTKEYELQLDQKYGWDKM